MADLYTDLQMNSEMLDASETIDRKEKRYAGNGSPIFMIIVLEVGKISDIPGVKSARLKMKINKMFHVKHCSTVGEQVDE